MYGLGITFTIGVLCGAIALSDLTTRRPDVFTFGLLGIWYLVAVWLMTYLPLNALQMAGVISGYLVLTTPIALGFSLLLQVCRSLSRAWAEYWI